MRKRIVKFKEKEPVIGIAVLFLLGSLAGFLFIRLMEFTSGDTYLQVDEGYLRQIAAVKPGMDLYLYTVWKQLEGIAIFFLLSLTWLNLPYITWILLRQGFLFGFLLTSMLKKYQMGGLFLVFSYYFPQAAIKVPLWVCCFLLGWQAWKEGKSSQEEGKTDLHKINMLHLNGKRVMIIMACCFAQSAAETWLGTWLLQKAVQMLL